MARSHRGIGVTLAWLALTGCGSTGGGPAMTPGTPQDRAFAALDGGPVELVPTTPSLLGTCAPEYARTYCTPAEALTAAHACEARLGTAQTADCDPDRGCVVPYVPTRPGACVSGPVYPTAAACATPVADNCAYYRSCLEAAHPCGATGYALSFGEPLCYLFIDHRAEFTPAGQQWLRDVRACLQQALGSLVTSGTVTCDDLATQAFASHTRCYTAAQDSFCALPPADVVRLAHLLAPYFHDPRVTAQTQAVAAICAGNAGH